MATAFETEMGVLPELSKAVAEMDWILPTDIQSEAVPLILGGGDVLMAAETGSGKTGAFCLPILQIVYETIKNKDNKKSATKGKSSSLTTCKMNVYDRDDAMAIDNDGLLCQSRDQQKWHGTRCNKGVKGAGKYYYEAEVTDEGLCRVGWSTMKADRDIGKDRNSFGFGGTGKASHNKQFNDYGAAFGLNDIIGCFIDLDEGYVKWSKNGEIFPKAFDIPNQHSAFFPSVCLKNAEIRFNFGQKPFKHPPKGWTPIANADKKYTVLSDYSSGHCSVVSKDLPNAPLAIIIEPSRELAEQTHTQLIKFRKYLNDPSPRNVLLLGGVSVKEQREALNAGVDIVVATPGRLDDLIGSEALSLQNCRFFVLDEADSLISQGHLELINRIHAKTPKVTNDGTRLQMVVCSATLHSFDVKKMAEKLMQYPTWVDLKGQDSVPETVHHVVCYVNPSKDTRWKQLLESHSRGLKTDGVHLKDKMNVHIETPETLSEAVKLLKGEYVLAAIEEHKMPRALIFCRTKLDCDNLEQLFISKGGGPYGKNKDFTCVCLHSDRNPKERTENLKLFKNEKVRFLICTDVAARGIDITGLPYVINMTLPDEKQNYVHRIGRVGRAERMGLAISLVSTVKEKVWYHSNCNTRGRGCYNTNLVERGGCCIWYNEPQLLGDIEEHLGITIDNVDPSLKVPVNEFDGKVVYGQKVQQSFSSYEGHAAQLASSVQQLADMEKLTQMSYLELNFGCALTSS